jgi:hypothetical protein
MVATIISTVIANRAQIQDALWKKLKYHAMGQVKSMEGLFKFVKCVGKPKRPASEQQSNTLQVFMLPHNYDEDTTNEYTQNAFSYNSQEQFFGTTRISCPRSTSWLTIIKSSGIKDRQKLCGTSMPNGYCKYDRTL